MRRLAIATVALFAAGPAMAGEASMAWGRCLVRSTGAYAAAGIPRTDTELVQYALEACQPLMGAMVREHTGLAEVDAAVSRAEDAALGAARVVRSLAKQ